MDNGPEFEGEIQIRGTARKEGFEDEKRGMDVSRTIRNARRRKERYRAAIAMANSNKGGYLMDDTSY